MKVTVKYLIYVVADSFGNTDNQTVSESGYTVQICGMKNKRGEELCFESEGYHVEGWCRENNLEFYCFERKEVLTLTNPPVEEKR